MYFLQVVQLSKLNQGHPFQSFNSLSSHLEISPANDIAATDLPQSPATQNSDDLKAERLDDWPSHHLGSESAWFGDPSQPDNPQPQDSACGKAAVSTSTHYSDTSKPSPQTQAGSQQGILDSQMGTKASSRPSSWQRRKAAKHKLRQTRHPPGTLYVCSHRYTHT